MARKAKFQEHQPCLDWLNANKEKNDFDPEVLNYPTSELYVSPNENPKACIPIHGVVMLESMGFNTDDPKERLEASLDLIQHAVERARALGVKEIVYLSSDERTDAFATKVLGFREVKAFRKVLP